MRSVGKVLLSLAVVACLAQVAQADAYLWWTLNASTGAEATATDSGFGKALTINQNVGTTTYTLDMWMQTTTGEDSTSYSARLYRPTSAGPLDANIVAQSIAYMNPLWSTVTPAVPSLNASPYYVVSSWTEAAGVGEGAMPTGTAYLCSRLVVNVTVGAVGEAHNMSEAVGTGKFAHLGGGAGGFVSKVFFGASAFVNGGTVSAMGNVPVIQILGVPEPATLVLFGLGLVGLIRRR